MAGVEVLARPHDQQFGQRSVATSPQNRSKCRLQVQNRYSAALTPRGKSQLADRNAQGARQVATVDGPLSNDTISYTYDELGRVVGRAINSVAATQAYDALGRVTNATNALGTFTYGYDGTTSRLTSVTNPNGQATIPPPASPVARRRCAIRQSFDIIFDKFSSSAMISVREYLAADGTNPFREWLTTLDVAVRARVQARVLRFETGNLGDHKSVGDGVFEARLDFGPGYRIYFGKVGRAVVLLLAGGSKSTQAKDIGRAQRFWSDYLERKRHGETK